MYFVNEFKRKNRGFSFPTLNNNEPNFPFLLSQVESLGNRLWDTHVGSWSEHVLRSNTCFGKSREGGRGGRGLTVMESQQKPEPAHRALGSQGVSWYLSTVLELAPLGLGRVGFTHLFPLAWQMTSYWYFEIGGMCVSYLQHSNWLMQTIRALSLSIPESSTSIKEDRCVHLSTQIHVISS